MGIFYVTTTFTIIHIGSMYVLLVTLFITKLTINNSHISRIWIEYFLLSGTTLAPFQSNTCLTMACRLTRALHSFFSGIRLCLGWQFVGARSDLLRLLCPFVHPALPFVGPPLLRLSFMEVSLEKAYRSLEHVFFKLVLIQFFYCRKEIPTRLANMIMELQLLPATLMEQRECLEIYQDYIRSFR